ncbi:hypothetical protein [Halomicrobium sp. IBSBa]|nr:hypothetical protein [Halomicrobium sp. IBSBa]
MGDREPTLDTGRSIPGSPAGWVGRRTLSGGSLYWFAHLALLAE